MFLVEFPTIYTTLKLILISVIFIILGVAVIYIRSFRKLALYGFFLAIGTAYLLDMTSFVADILFIAVLVLISLYGVVLALFSKNGSGGSGGSHSRRSSRGGGFSFGGSSRGGRSFGGGGRSGGGGAFRR